MQSRSHSDKFLATRGDRWRGRIPVPDHVHPLVGQLIQHANAQETTLTEIGDRAGIRRSTISNWRYRCVPQLPLLEAALNVLGLELYIRRRRDS